MERAGAVKKTLFKVQGIEGVKNFNVYSCNSFDLSSSAILPLQSGFVKEMINNKISIVDYQYGLKSFSRIYCEENFGQRFLTLIHDDQKVSYPLSCDKDYTLFYHPEIGEEMLLRSCQFSLQNQESEEIEFRKSFYLELPLNLSEIIFDDSEYLTKLDMMANLNKYREDEYLVIRSALLGDICMALAAIASIKKAYPNLIFDFATSDNLKELVKKSGLVRDVYVVNDEESLPDFFNKNVLNWANNKVKSSCPISVTDGFISHSPFSGVKVNVDDIHYDFDISVDSEVVQLLSTDKPNVGISLSSNSIYKSLDKNSIDRIVDELLSRNVRVINLGNGVMKNHDDYIDISFNLSPYELFHLISQIDLLITVDTGPMHIAAISDVPFYSIFSSSSPTAILQYVFRSNRKFRTTIVNNPLQHLCIENIDAKSIVNKSFEIL